MGGQAQERLSSARGMHAYTLDLARRSAACLSHSSAAEWAAKGQVSVSRALVGPDVMRPAGTIRSRRNHVCSAHIEAEGLPSQHTRNGRPASVDVAGRRCANPSCTRRRGVRRGVNAKPPGGDRRKAGEHTTTSAATARFAPRRVQPEYMVRRPLANAGRSDGERDRAEHELVLRHELRARAALHRPARRDRRQAPASAQEPEHGGTRRRRRFRSDRVRRRSRIASARRGPRTARGRLRAAPTVQPVCVTSLPG